MPDVHFHFHFNAGHLSATSALPCSVLVQFSNDLSRTRGLCLFSSLTFNFFSIFNPFKYGYCRRTSATTAILKLIFSPALHITGSLRNFVPRKKPFLFLFTARNHPCTYFFHETGDYHATIDRATKHASWGIYQYTNNNNYAYFSIFEMHERGKGQIFTRMMHKKCK